MPVFESSRKVQVTGSSLAITLPALFVKANEVEKGSVVNVLYDIDGVLIISHFEGHETIEGLMKILEKLEEKVRIQDKNIIKESM
jgi:antitoxin component of MazEF toxin-antitoxin module